MKTRSVGLKRIVLLTSLTLVSTWIPAASQSVRGRIDVFISRGGLAEGVSDVSLTLVGPSPVVSSAQIAGLYTPNPALTSDMKAQVDALIASAPIGISAEVIATVATRLEAQLLGLPSSNLPTPGNAATLPQITGTSNRSGRYSFMDLSPGRYQIRAQREGYFGAPPAGYTGISLPTAASATVTLEIGKPSTELTIAMVRGATVSGRVRDPNGQAMSGAQVGAFQISYQNGRAVLQQLNSKQTDDRGEYRLFWLPPGEYYLGVIPPRGAINAPSVRDAYVRTYFPGTTNPGSATRIKVPEGGDVAGIDFGVRGDAIGKVSGRVVTSIVLPNGQPATASTFYLLPTVTNPVTDVSSLNFPNMTSDRTNGHFELRGILPGSYDLVTTITSSTNGPAFGRTRIDVGAGEVDNVVLNVGQGRLVKARLLLDFGAVPYIMTAPAAPGIVQIEGAARAINGAVVPQSTQAPTPTPTYRLQLRSMESNPASFDSAAQQGMVFDRSGLFTFPNVPTGRYSVTVSPIPPNSYIADVRSGDKSVFDGGFEAGELTGELEVSVSSKGGRILGIVRDASQKPVPAARVVLVPASERRQNSALYKTVAADANGKFVITGVAPGEYSLYSWETVSANAWMNADFMSRYEGKGQRVSVAQVSETSKDITIIPANAPD